MVAVALVAVAMVAFVAVTVVVAFVGRHLFVGGITLLADAQPAAAQHVVARLEDGLAVVHDVDPTAVDAGAKGSFSANRHRIVVVTTSRRGFTEVFERIGDLHRVDHRFGEETAAFIATGDLDPARRQRSGSLRDGGTRTLAVDEHLTVRDFHRRTFGDRQSLGSRRLEDIDADVAVDESRYGPGFDLDFGLAEGAHEERRNLTLDDDLDVIRVAGPAPVLGRVVHVNLGAFVFRGTVQSGVLNGGLSEALHVLLA